MKIPMALTTATLYHAVLLYFFIKYTKESRNA